MADFIEPNSHLEEIVEDLDELNEVLPANFSITSYGADYPVDGLVKRIAQGDILVPLFSLEPEVGQTTVGHSSVANSTASNDRHGPRRWMISAL
jgi:hypothetical protein